MTGDQALRLFTATRRTVAAVGLARPLRRWLGPWAGRLAYQRTVPVGSWQRIHGHDMILASGAAYPPLEMMVGRWELDTVRLLERSLRPAQVVVDLGAHVGYFTLIAARAVGPSGRVYAFEPEPENYRLLEGNVARSGYRHVRTVPCAVSERTGTAELRSSGLDNGQHSLCATGRPERRRQVVRTVRLAEFFQAERVARVDWIKMDIEGSEAAALRGMEVWLRDLRTVRLIVEFCPMVLRAAGEDPAAFLDGLREMGFALFLYGSHSRVRLDAAAGERLVAHLDRHRSYKNLLCVKGDVDD